MSQGFPQRRARMEYVCMNCGHRHPVDQLLYTCPDCGGVLLLEDLDFDEMKEKGAQYWRDLFDARRATRRNALRGIFRFYELMAPVLEEEDIVYLGEGDTPIIEASAALQKHVGRRFAYKNDGMNPSASFKDRGMACAFSYLKWLCRRHQWDEVLTVCASTGDTSAAAALYASGHVDPEHWMDNFGDSMDAFRARVAAMIGEDTTVRPTWDEMRRDTIRKGAKSHAVAEMQGILLTLGYGLGKSGADGKYGSATQKAVKKFQADNELTPDGVAGPATWRKALELIAAIEGEDKPAEAPDGPQEPEEDSSVTSPLTYEERLTRLERAVFGEEGGESDG